MLRRIPRFVSTPPNNSSSSSISSYQIIARQRRRRLWHSISQRHDLSTWTTTSTATNDTYNYIRTTSQDTFYPYQQQQQQQQQRRWHSSSKLTQQTPTSSTVVTTAGAASTDFMDDFYDSDDHGQDFLYDDEILDLEHDQEDDFSIHEEEEGEYDTSSSSSSSSHSPPPLSSSETTPTTTPQPHENLKDFQARRKDQARQLSQLLLHHVSVQDFKYWRMKLKSASRRNFESTLHSMEVLSPITPQTSVRDMLRERLDYAFVPLPTSENDNKNDKEPPKTTTTTISKDDDPPQKKKNKKTTRTRTTTTGKAPPLWVQEILLSFLEDELPLDFSKQTYYQRKLQDCFEKQQEEDNNTSVAAVSKENDDNDDDDDVVVKDDVVVFDHSPPPQSQPTIIRTHHQGYGPIVNRLQFPETVQTLMAFQHVIATHYPMFVNFKDRTKVKKKYNATFQTAAAEAIAQAQAATEHETDTDIPHESPPTVDDDDDDDDNDAETPKKSKKTKTPPNITTPQFFKLLTKDISAKHSLKSSDQRLEEATNVAHILAERLPPDAHARLLSYMQDFVTTLENSSSPIVKGKNSKQQLLIGTLEHLMGDSTVLIVLELAKFLYVMEDIQDFIAANPHHLQNKDHHDQDDTATTEESSSSISSTTTTTTMDDNHNVVQDHDYYPSVLKELDLPIHLHDGSLKSMLKQRKTSENQFVDSLLRMANTKVFNILELRKELADSGGGIDKDKADNEAYEKMLQQLQNASLTKKERRQRKTKQQKYKLNQQNRFHVVYDAIELQWDDTNMANNLMPTATTSNTTTTSVVDEPPLPPPPAERPTNRTVFLDNLPIDVEEMELIDLYSRCGVIASVQIFNKREEYDPGPLSAKQKRALIKRKKHTYLGRQGKYVRPRSPVYAILTFADEDACQKALDPTLSVFGKVIRRHAVLSTACTKMTTLYVEEIPNGHYAIDIERKLSHLLHPHFYVCLDKSYGGGGGVSGGSTPQDNNNAPPNEQPGSCAIQFPTFEMAHQAYWKLQELRQEHQQQQKHQNDNDTIDRAWSIQWMKTPLDAIEYWKRESVIDRR